MAHLKKNSPYLQIDFRVDGVRYAFSSGTRSRAEADRIQARAMDKARRLSPPARGRRDCTFDEAAFMYWDHQGQSTRDADNLRGMIRRCVLMVGAGTMCSSIDLKAILGYRRDLRKGLKSVPALKGGREPRNGKYGARTVNKYLGVVFTILRSTEAVLTTRFPDLPRPSDSDDVDEGIMEIVRPRNRHLRPEEELRLEKVSEPDLLDMWKADLELGLRESNLCDARWSEVDMLERTITVQLKAEGNSPLPHRVYLSDKAVEILERRRGIHPEFVFTLPCRTTCWLDSVMRLKGEHIPVSRTLFYSRMKEAWTAAGISNLIVHDFRRTAARRKWQEKDIYYAQLFLGHRDIQTTCNYIGLDSVEAARTRHSAGGRA